MNCLGRSVVNISALDQLFVTPAPALKQEVVEPSIIEVSDVEEEEESALLSPKKIRKTD